MIATDTEIAELTRWDTPTICNGLEAIVPESRLAGYTQRSFVLACAGPTSASEPRAVCGRARTVRLRSRDAATDPADRGSGTKADYYDYIATGDDAPGGARDGAQGGAPGGARDGARTIVVAEDLDDEPLGAFWGEVHSALHYALGAAGAITNGTVRDLDDLDPRFFLAGGGVAPSHAHVRWVDFGQGATVFGMRVADGDIVHADRHGAVVVPAHAVARLPGAIAAMQAREARVLTLARGAEPIDLAALRALSEGETH